MSDRYEKLDGAERWFHDGLHIIRPADFFVSDDVDMTATREIIAQMRQQGIKGTYTHVIVRAVALAFARHPTFNRLLLRKHKVYPQAVDIALTVNTGLTIPFPPTFVLQDAQQKTLLHISQEIIQRANDLRTKDDERRLVHLRKAARILPASWLRRLIMRLMMSRLSVVRERAGTFHVTSLPLVAQGIPFKFPAPIMLSIARVEERVIAKDGQAVVRPMATLTIAGDDRLWTGNTVGIFLNEVKKILETGNLMAEVSHLPVNTVAGH